jgi:hypothetical protein
MHMDGFIRFASLIIQLIISFCYTKLSISSIQACPVTVHCYSEKFITFLNNFLISTIVLFWSRLDPDPHL